MDPGALPGDREWLKGRARTRPGWSYRNVGQAGSRATQEMGVSGQHETMCQGQRASLYKLHNQLQ